MGGRPRGAELRPRGPGVPPPPEARGRVALAPAPVPWSTSTASSEATWVQLPPTQGEAALPSQLLNPHPTSPQKPETQGVPPHSCTENPPWLPAPSVHLKPPSGHLWGDFQFWKVLGLSRLRAAGRASFLIHRFLPVRQSQPYCHLKSPKEALTRVPLLTAVWTTHPKPLINVGGPSMHYRVRAQWAQLPESRPGSSALAHPLRGLKCPEYYTMTHDNRMISSSHRSTQQEFMGTCPKPVAAEGTGDPWVKVTDRSHPQAGAPKPHSEHGLKKPKPAPRGGRLSARHLLAALTWTDSSAGWELSKSLSKTVK